MIFPVTKCFSYLLPLPRLPVDFEPLFFPAAFLGEVLRLCELFAAAFLGADFLDADFLEAAFFGAAFFAAAFFGADLLAAAFFGALRLALFLGEAFLSAAFFGAAFLGEAFLGTFLPSLLASLKPIATACLREVTFLPVPVFSLPSFISCMVCSTFLPAAREYFAIIMNLDGVSKIDNMQSLFPVLFAEVAK